MNFLKTTLCFTNILTEIQAKELALPTKQVGRQPLRNSFNQEWDQDRDRKEKQRF